MLKCIEKNVKKIIHIKVPMKFMVKNKMVFHEKSKINPTNPYSASKAAAEIFINSYIYSYKKEIIKIVRANNIYGIRQYPKIILPRCIVSLLRGQKIPIHGNGI